LSDGGNDQAELIDVRYFAVCVLRIEMEGEMDNDSRSNHFLIIAATSDGKLLVYGFHVKQNRCYVLAVLQRAPTILSTVLSLAVQPERCVQCKSNEPTLVGAGTSDGYVYIFDITPACHHYRASVQQYGQPTDPVTVDAAFTWRAHLSGINCLHLVELSGQAAAEQTSVLVVSGGDDQALGASMLSVGLKATSMMHRVHVDNAHWAAVTAIAIFHLQSEVHVVSVGCDQRLRVWKLLSLSDSMQPPVLSEQFVHALQVADPSSVNATTTGITGVKNAVHFVVAGMGMESIDFLI
jgi:hypothetical protein